VRLSGWWAPGRNGAAVVVVHGGGGDREGAIAHARMLSRAGYGVLLYDARGRGRSGGHENAFGWRWHRDVRGAVDFLDRRGIEHISLLGLSTGAEAVITEAAGDARVGAVIADGVQVRSAADAAALPTADRLAVQPVVGLMGAEIRAVAGERPPAPLAGLIRRVATRQPLLMIATIPLERTILRRSARGTGAELWELPGSGHTRGLRDHPREYARRVASLLAAGR
jgi:pimeloyl-ACP methyl ester carboxylesterase